MHFLYLKSTGAISPPIKKGEPEVETVDKKLVCSLGSGVKWGSVDLFYAPDSEFADDFIETAPQGKYFVKGNAVEEDLNWAPQEEDPHGYTKPNITGRK